MLTKEEGPYVQAAAFCQEVLREDDGTFSLIRMVDTFTHTRKGEDAPEEMPAFPLDVKALIAFKSGGASGDFSAQLDFISPSGEQIQNFSHDFKLKGAGHGYNIVADISIEPVEEGLYWLNVNLEDELVTRMPLRIDYKRVPETGEEH